ncbi:hypothetical protein A9Q84_05330 [Halobacteriovorax marinus]|uniref:Uncharacterized protein n=1 Tax=Halobacteriovorax marinus TaxID=97084 RepID=A0A1Y5FB54_9BACT|nr:hypothetical protein A9Q84_05330 [Halobacteriovorax marinus]
MDESYQTLVADTAFIEPKQVEEYNFINVFPMKKGDEAYRASLDEILYRSKLQSKFYKKVEPKLLKIFTKLNPYPAKQNFNFVHFTLVTLTTFFCDRTLRVIERTNQTSKEKLRYLKIKEIDTIEFVSGYTQSWKFNQNLVMRISSSLGIKPITSKNDFVLPENPSLHIQKNLLFLPSSNKVTQYIYRIINKIFSFIQTKMSSHNKIQPMGLHDSYHFTQKGFYGLFGFFKNPIKLKFTHKIKDFKLRNLLKKEISEHCFEEFREILTQNSPELDKISLDNLTKEFINLFVDWFPTSLLEASENNIKEALSSISSKKIKAVIGNDSYSDQGMFISVAAQRLGKPSIGIQHGGHVGYIEDMAYCGQLEFPLCTKFISWGWNKIEGHFPSCNVVPMPSPKLSQNLLKSDYFSHNDKKQGDIVFYSNLFHRFPHQSMCGHSRVDLIDDIFESLETFIKVSCDAGISIFHKPYSMKSVDLYPDFFNKIQELGGNNYSLVTSKTKGLSIDFLKKYRLIAFDQIGSGTLDCFTSKVPAMIYYKRIYSREVSWARGLYSELEKVGVVHQTPESFAKEVQIYLNSPRKWMEDPQRIRAIENFCSEYAHSSKDWSKEWKFFLKSLL